MQESGTRRRVLIVEDDPESVEVFRLLLQQWGHEGAIAATGSDALLSLGAAVPDVVVLDLGLPDMDGCDVAPEIRRLQGDRVLIVALTGYAEPSDRQRALEAGCDAFFTKPARLDQLRAVIESVRSPVVQRPATKHAG